MKSTHLIFAAAALFSACWASAAERYSLWPRRPAEIEQARQLLRERRAEEAVNLLLPHMDKEGIAGREARQLMGAANTPAYLSLRHPGASIYTVRRGDHLSRISSALHCPHELLMMLNGIVDPASIHVGQKLVYVPMRQRVEINLPRREICVWDGDVLVASYDIMSAAGFDSPSPADANATVTQRDGYVDGGRLPAWSPLMACADRRISLSNGVVLTAEPGAAGKVLRVRQVDLNELALLVAVGSPANFIFRAADIPEAVRAQP